MALEMCARGIGRRVVGNLPRASEAWSAGLGLKRRANDESLCALVKNGFWPGRSWGEVTRGECSFLYSTECTPRPGARWRRSSSVVVYYNFFVGTVGLFNKAVNYKRK